MRFRTAVISLVVLLVSGFTASVSKAEDYQIFGYGSSAWGFRNYLSDMALEAGHTANVNMMDCSSNIYTSAIDDVYAGLSAVNAYDGTNWATCQNPYAPTDTTAFTKFTGYMPDDWNRWDSDGNYIGPDADSDPDKVYRVWRPIMDVATDFTHNVVISDIHNTGTVKQSGVFQAVDNNAYHVDNGSMSKAYHFFQDYATRTVDSRAFTYQHFAPPNDCADQMVGMENGIRSKGLIGPTAIATEDSVAYASSMNFMEYTTDVNPDVTPVLAGAVLYWAQKDAEWGYIPHLTTDEVAAGAYDDLVKPELPYADPDNNFRMSFKWRQGDDGWYVDQHLNANGNYLVACLFYEQILGESVLDSTFVPDPEKVTAADAAILRRMAHEYLNDSSKVALTLSPGDANLDAIVDGLDLAILNANLGLEDEAGMLWWAGDFNSDGIVDLADQAIWAAHAPEPATMSLLAVGGIGMLVRRRRSKA